MDSRRADSRRIDDRLTPALDEAEIAQVWRGVRDAQADARRAPRRRRFALMALGGSAALAAAVAALVMWLGGSAPHPVRPGGPVHSAATALDPGVRVSAAAERALPMNDGSVVTLAPATELEVLANEGDKFVTAVRRGRARFDVRAGGPRRWVVETDLATVEVVGTAFSVERSDAQLHVVVEHGVVLVRGERVPGRVVRLTAGETLEILVTPTITAAAAETATEAEAEAEAEAATEAATATATEAATATAAATGTRTTAGLKPAAIPTPAGRITGTGTGTGTGAATTTAATSLPEIKSPALAAPRAAEAVIADADRLLAAGNPSEAAAVLDAYLDDAPAGPSAGLAAFLLGRIAQDSLHDPERASAAFARTMQLGSPRAVLPEALARRARALADAGRLDQAADLARRYLDRHPSGSATAAMRRLVERASGAP